MRLGDVGVQSESLELIGRPSARVDFRWFSDQELATNSEHRRGDLGDHRWRPKTTGDHCVEYTAQMSRVDHPFRSAAHHRDSIR